MPTTMKFTRKDKIRHVIRRPTPLEAGPPALGPFPISASNFKCAVTENTVLSIYHPFSAVALQELKLACSAQPHEFQIQVGMIIKNLFRRYERWNPVHPTIGAFWGFGVGIGCGIGWGPGFGPEVVGYVGAGCGAGFNVGFTLLGAGIGFPANYLLAIPHSAFLVARKGSLDGHLTGNRSIIEDDGWGANGSYISGTQQSRGASFSGFKIDNLKVNIGDMPDMRSMLVAHAKHITDCLHRVSRDLLQRDRGAGDSVADPKSRLEDP
ncbi:hypothetical protein C2S53_002622 [Perilla frutescens var. hirtella]|uniref:Cadmium-induced protein AS8 n=1 Tax=Perilla frutescens var. hirtella TaxID=608512 RepID=A0AAD4NZ33_PERFH|nr:hypothetical protein C2S53_002622 [Perilla frutescens var. hirtella]